MKHNVNFNLNHKVKVKSFSKKYHRRSTLKKILSLSIILALILPINILNFTNEFYKPIKEENSFTERKPKFSNSGDELFKFVIGTGGFASEGSYNIDPQNSWDSASFELINQVCEGLFSYNLSDPDYGVVPQLAEDYGIWNSNNYTVSLKTGVTFHDGTPFNATAVKFTFDRLAYFMNNAMAMAGSLYEYFDPDLDMIMPIINKTEIVDANTIKFVLNKVYGLFETLLCFPASYILSPTSTPPTERINNTIGDLVGTGPFVYDYINVGVEAKLHAFEDYWAGKANITVLQFLVIPNNQDRNDALLSGEIDFLLGPLASMIPTFEDDPEISVINTGENTVPAYLSMNTNIINVTWREAISYAINYSQVIDDLANEYSVRLKSPIPGSILFANWSFDVATFNITRAREILQTMGFGGGWDTSYPGGNEGDWSSASFATYDYTYNYGNPTREGLLPILQNNLAKVGIVVVDDGLDWGDWVNTVYDPINWNSMDLVLMAWGADYNDPSNYINNLFTNRTEGFNLGQYNGYTAAIEGGRDPFDLWDNVQLLMEAALFETDQNLRESYYDRIQEILVEEDMPWAYLYNGPNIVAYRNYILDFQPTALPYLSFYSVSQNSSIAPQTIHIDGNMEWQLFKDTGRCTGQGTLSEPYIIRALVIDGKNDLASCIQIENSDVYFIIQNCTLFNSTGSGIELNNVTNSQLIDNICSDNNFGISLDLNSVSNDITGNFISNNNQTGITLNGAQNNLIFNNIIIWNTNNAYDSGTNNDWDNGAIGNHWSDYGGVDTDDDGIGDTPYTIPGPSASQDNFPVFDNYITPGIVENLSPGEIIKIGVINDMNHMSGINIWKGAYLAAKEINEAGGVLINSSTYFIGLVSQNTFEFEEPLDIQKTVDSVNNLISIHDPDFIIGSTRHEAGAAYLEPIMDAKIPFLGTGNTLENLTQNVLDDYNRYKYFFRLLINGSTMVAELLTFQIYLTSYLDAVLSRPINKIAFFYEELYKFPEIVDFLKSVLPSYGIEMVKEITYNSSTSKAEFDQYWNEIDNAGAQLTLVGSFFSDNARLLSESYGDVKPRCLVFNNYLNGTTNTYWTQTNGGCEYEISYHALYNISRTSRSKPFWNNFVDEYNHEPIFGSMSAYNAIYLIVNASQDSQSFIAHKIVDSLEKIDTNNPFPGVAGKIAFLPSHDIFSTLGYGSGLMCQWQSGGTKVVIPNGDLIYLDSLATGSLQPPDWGVNIRFTINTPTENNPFSEIPPTFNIEILDAVDKMWYTLNTDPTKYFFTINGSIDFTAWTALSEGVNRINFYANESSGEIYRRYVNIIKDTLPANVTIVSTGSDTDTFGSEAPIITLNISDTSGVVESYYSLDGGVTRIPFTGNIVTINQTLWDLLGEGVVTIAFYFIDAVGKETIIYKDVVKWLGGGFDPFIFIIIGIAAVSIGVLSTVVITQVRRKKRRKTAWTKLKKKKGLISPEEAEGKCLIFMSYATKDSTLFQIPLITEILTQYPEIDDILYWESDMHDDIYEYMDDNLKLCSAFLLFCTENSLYSEPVKMEWRSALKLEKKIIPIFINPNDIPPLLTTKLGVQYNTSDIYDSIEALYQMILQKLELTSTREFCKYLIPKKVSEDQFDEKAGTMIKKDIEIETDLPIDDLQNQLITILKRNNFQFLGKPIDIEEIDKVETQLISLRFFAEDKFEKQEIASKVTIQRVDDLKSKIYLRVMGNKEWMIKEIISDIDNKFYSLKTVTELLRQYSEKIKGFMNQIKDIDEFLRPKLGAEIKKIEETIQQYSSKKIDNDEFIKSGIQLLGKRFILLFIENLPLAPDERKKPEEDGEAITPLL